MSVRRSAVAAVYAVDQPGISESSRFLHKQLPSTLLRDSFPTVYSSLWVELSSVLGSRAILPANLELQLLMSSLKNSPAVEKMTGTGVRPEDSPDPNSSRVLQLPASRPSTPIRILANNIYLTKSNKGCQPAASIFLRK